MWNWCFFFFFGFGESNFVFDLTRVIYTIIVYTHLPKSRSIYRVYNLFFKIFIEHFEWFTRIALVCGYIRLQRNVVGFVKCKFDDLLYIYELHSLIINKRLFIVNQTAVCRQIINTCHQHYKYQ